jgi:hypothetical protein
MGRARASTITGFDAVFGRGRGSEDAQAQRDRDEKHERERALDRWPSQFSEFDGFSSGTVFIARDLVLAYRQGVSAETTAQDLIKKFRNLRNNAEDVEVLFSRQLIAIIEGDEPWGTTDLTLPAVIALTHQLQRFPSDNVAARDLCEETLEAILLREERVHTSRSHWSWQPLLAAITPVIADLGIDNDTSVLGQEALRVMTKAPVDALLGPMRKWIDAFSTLIDQDAYTHDEALEMRKLVSKYEVGSEAAQALAAIAKASDF